MSVGAGVGLPCPGGWQGGLVGGKRKQGRGVRRGSGGGPRETRQGPASHRRRQQEKGLEARTGFRVNLQLAGTSRGDCKE